jgi:hypothetical protein
VVTLTWTPAPAVPAGVVVVIVVLLTTVKPVVRVVDPNLTSVAPVKSVPVMVTNVPPAAGPEPGAMLSTCGGVPPPPPAVYVNFEFTSGTLCSPS